MSLKKIVIEFETKFNGKVYKAREIRWINEKYETKYKGHN